MNAISPYVPLACEHNLTSPLPARRPVPTAEPADLFVATAAAEEAAPSAGRAVGVAALIALSLAGPAMAASADLLPRDVPVTVSTQVGRGEASTAGKSQATPATMEGGQDGYPMDWRIQPRPDGTTRIDGHQAGYGMDLTVVPQGNGVIQIDGHQAGYGMDLTVRRTARGLELRGHQSGWGMSLDISKGADGSVIANGAANGSPAGFVVRKAGQALVIEGGKGGRPLGVTIQRAPDGSLRFTGGQNGYPVDMTMRGLRSLDDLGDFLTDLDPMERAAVFYVLESAKNPIT